MPRYIHLREITSTNSYLSKVASTLPSGTVIYTYRQTAGRGQKGNSWESEPGKNLSFSSLFKGLPVSPAHQFAICEAVSVAIAEVLAEESDGIKIKWPNDIYHHDGKLCGILIEHSLVDGAIAHTIAGVGVNVNQTRFVSDAPNPVSLAGITGRDYDLDSMLHRVCERIEAKCACLGNAEAEAGIHRQYLSMLYWNDALLHTFELHNGERFFASVGDVLPDGTLCLHAQDGTVRQFRFKEVKHVINDITL